MSGAKYYDEVGCYACEYATWPSYCIAQFIRELLCLRDRPSTDNSCNVFTRTEINCIVRYLATA